MYWRRSKLKRDSGNICMTDSDYAIALDGGGAQRILVASSQRTKMHLRSHWTFGHRTAKWNRWRSIELYQKELPKMRWSSYTLDGSSDLPSGWPVPSKRCFRELVLCPLCRYRKSDWLPLVKYLLTFENANITGITNHHLSSWVPQRNAQHISSRDECT